MMWSCTEPCSIASDTVFIPYPNHFSSGCSLLTELLVYCRLVYSSLVQAHNLLPGVIRRLFGLGPSGEVVAIHTANKWRLDKLNICLFEGAKHFFLHHYTNKLFESHAM